VAVLVTGATGLVGSQLVEDLIEDGYPPNAIRALVRSQSDTRFLQDKGVQLCYGDVLDMPSLKAAVEDVKTVFHCAAAVDEKEKTLFWKVNVNGLDLLLEAARFAAVEKFIYVSTIGIYGLLHEIPATEDHPKNPLRPYGMSKLAAEQKVWEYHQDHGLETVVVRPTAIVGERDRTITRHIMKLVRKRFVPIVGGGKARVSFVHVKDLTRAIILASKCGKAVGRVYNVEGFSAPIKEVIELFVKAMGSRAKIINIPYPIAYVGALSIDGFYAIARNNNPPLRARKGIQQLTRDLVFDTTKIKTDLSFEPRYGMEDSMRQAIQWQLEHGY
jgi:nucleoside-diphosphate-sugar epimerase